MDEGLVVATKRRNINEFLDKLKTEFKITTDPVGCFLNVQIDRLEDGSIVIVQKKYAEDVLKRFNMEDANSISK